MPLLRMHLVRRYWREWVIVLIALASAAALFLMAPIPQDRAYHDFADNRELLGVPNFANVASNIAFLVVGLMGLAPIARLRSGAVTSWRLFFVGVALVGLGSAYYHLAPRDETLVWDRLPMTLAFMALFVALLSEHIHSALDRWALMPALVAGLASVAYWHYADDLRFYVWIQAMPFLTIPFVLVLFRPAFTNRVYLLWGLGFYVLAKVAEYYDRQLFALTGQGISGHAAKHLLAALAVFCVYLMLNKRHSALSLA